MGQELAHSDAKGLLFSFLNTHYVITSKAINGTRLKTMRKILYKPMKQ